MHASVLKYFVEVARCGSVRKASENLYVAASAINRQIIKLEDELGGELFDRMPSGMRLNPAGERLLRHIQTTLHDFQVMRTELDALKGERTGHVKVASMDSLFVDFLPSAIEEFSEIYPAVTYTTASFQPMDVVAQLQSGRADVGLTFVGRLPAGIAAVALATLPAGVVMAAGHPLAEKPAISLAECARVPFIRSIGQSPIGSTMSREFAQFWDDVEPVITSSWTGMIKRLIIAGKGISFFSKIAFIDELKRGDVVWRPFDLPELNELKVGILVPSHRALPHVTQTFVGRMEKRLRQLEAVAASL
ncbi:MAG TPA: LysR family transcriptional regulator [Burkholderiaceae bacterium]|jgi:DNA-binding transcriptional LysR family regulator